MKCRICGCELTELGGSIYDRDACSTCSEALYEAGENVRRLIEALAERIRRIESHPAPMPAQEKTSDG